MFLQDEIERLHIGGKEVYKNFFDKYAPQFYREALISNAGDQKAAAKKVLAIFCKVDELLKTGKDDDKIVALLTSAEQSNKIESICLNAVWRSFSRAIGYEDIEDGQFVNGTMPEEKIWHGGRKMETVKEHMYTETVQPTQRVVTEEIHGDENLLVQEYPDTVLEGAEMEEKRKKIGTQNIVMIIIMAVLILFLVWSITGMILATTAPDINIGFGPFIKAIQNLFGWNVPR